MAFLSEPDSGAGDLRDARRGPDGAVPNWVDAFLWRPEYFDGWEALSGAVRGRLDPRLYELVTLAAALELKSSYCALAHGSVLIGQGVSEAALEDIATDGPGDLTPGERLAMAYAARIARDASSVGQDDVDALLAAGFTPGEVTDIAAAAAMRCFFSKFLDALGVAADASHSRLPESLRAALVRGRPISDG